MSNILKKPNGSTGKFLKTIVAAAAFGACAIAHAGILNFEQPVDSPFVFSGDYIQMGEYWIQSYGGTQVGDLVGSIVDGSDSDTCFAVSCPVNNSSHYYAGLDDGYFYFGLNSGGSFKTKSLQASFIGAGQPSFAATAGILVLQGFNAAGGTVGGSLQVPLAGPTNGAFNFSTFNLGSFGNNSVAYVQVLGYACDTGGNCSRTSNLANFAIDNIVTVPEPTTWALLGLGLAGLALSRRRRA